MELEQEWDLGEDNNAMTWLQVVGRNLYYTHEVGQYKGQECGVVRRWRGRWC